jgi:cation:H+ antiporter
MLLDILILIIGLATLILGGEVLVRGATRMALRFQVSSLVVGLTIVAFSTSAPEFLVSLNAALKGVSDFALGNIVGSNITNLALVLGVAALIGTIPIDKLTARRDWPMTFGASILFFFFSRDGLLQHYEGYILFAILLAYLTHLLLHTKKDQIKLDVEEPDKNESKFEKYKDAILIIFGGICLYFGSEWFVLGGESIAIDFGISERIIGLTVLSIGTSLPELITSIIAAKKGDTNLALGNLFGSNIFNILSIIGLTTIITELPVNPAIFNTDMVWMLAITLSILPLMILRKRLGTPAGIILVSAYVLYVYFILT